LNSICVCDPQKDPADRWSRRRTHAASTSTDANGAQHAHSDLITGNEYIPASGTVGYRSDSTISAVFAPFDVDDGINLSSRNDHVPAYRVENCRTTFAMSEMMAAVIPVTANDQSIKTITTTATMSPTVQNILLWWSFIAADRKGTPGLAPHELSGRFAKRGV
jgi:hypothetical protein